MSEIRSPNRPLPIGGPRCTLVDIRVLMEQLNCPTVSTVACTPCSPYGYIGAPMTRTLKTGFLAATLLVTPLVALAQTDDAAKAFKEVMDKMHMAMQMDYVGDPDVQFVKSMIPHHQGAVDMAEVELKYGKDPQARAFAEKIIKAQKAEIEEFDVWLKQHGQ